MLVDGEVVAIGVTNDEKAAAGGLHDLGFDLDLLLLEMAEGLVEVFDFKGGPDSALSFRGDDIGDGDGGGANVEFDPSLAFFGKGVIHGAQQAKDIFEEGFGAVDVGSRVGDEGNTGDFDAHGDGAD